MSLHRCFTPGIMAGEEAEASPFEELTTVAGDGASATQHDSTITVPTGTSKLIVDVLFTTGAGNVLSSDVLDPGGTADALTSVVTQADHPAHLIYYGYLRALYDADMDASGSATLRATLSSADDVYRQTWTFHGAAQSLVTASSQACGFATISTVTLNGTFASGDVVYAVSEWQPNQSEEPDPPGYPAYDLDDADAFAQMSTQVADRTTGTERIIVYKQVLGSSASKIEVSFKPEFGCNHRVHIAFVVQAA